ncbi:hypothetical protein C0Q70_03888 [Pomacea canaliculata]|uniref:Uncharacterized protein n=1 Tax=Pomacea canaliculata TaxID=400727 RepID=A0A2T7PU38_POMCA|nr:hypothetical protein C0Q70_03888 [Pomacea canaliculata]
MGKEKDSSNGKQAIELESEEEDDEEKGIDSRGYVSRVGNDVGLYPISHCGQKHTVIYETKTVEETKA